MDEDGVGGTRRSRGTDAIGLARGNDEVANGGIDLEVEGFRAPVAPVLIYGAG